MGAGSDLGMALERLYETFSRYPLPDKIDVCDHCVAPESVQAARAVPLRALSASVLEPYAWSALSTWGDIEDFKYYLPRLLELLISEELDGFLHADSLTIKVGAYWHGWPQDEKDAVVAVANAWWWLTLHHYPRDVDVMKMIEIIADNLKLDLCYYLAEWESNTGNEAAALHMAWLVEDFPVQSGHVADWYVLLENWIDGSAPARILEDAISSPSSSQVEQDLLRALELHEWWSQRPK
ncbi:hypothetical protein [Streptosporangium roseum]|uniref:hypothetical protein n=1 Tax=Streptosporangium roseum TaxID=2001 RepID=UPI0033231759